MYEIGHSCIHTHRPESRSHGLGAKRMTDHPHHMVMGPMSFELFLTKERQALCLSRL